MRVKHTQNICCGLMMLVVMLSAGLAAGAETINYAYDPMGRLTRAESDDAAVWVYAYDTMGNRVTTTTTGSPLDVGVVAAYPFSEGSGPTTADASGHGHDGTITGATWTTDGKVGYALEFRDPDDEVVLANEQHFDFDQTDAFSLAAWIKVEDNTNYRKIISKMNHASPFAGYELIITDAGAILFQMISVWPAYLQVGTLAAGYDDNQWHHVVMTYDGSSQASGVTLYVDGQEKAITVNADTLSGSILNDVPCRIGRRTGQTGSPVFGGLMDEINIYQKALTAGEVQDLYGEPPSEPPVALAAYPFSEGGGITTADASGNGNDGTLVGTSWDPDGKVGYALEFRDPDDEVVLANEQHFDFDQTDAFSLAAWIKVEDNTNYRKIISKMNHVSPFAGYELIITDAGAILFQMISVWPAYLQVGTLAAGYDDNQWHHVVMTYDGSSQASGVTLYVDGQEKAITVNADTLSGSILNDVPCRIGRRTGQTGSPVFGGLMDEITFYDRALSANEIQDLAGVGGAAPFATSSFSESSASLTARSDDLVEVDGAYVYINVGESRDLNYGIGDFTVVVTARTADASSAREGTPPSTSLRTGPSREEYTPDSSQADNGLAGNDTPQPPSRGKKPTPDPSQEGNDTPLPPSRGEYTGSISHVAVGVRQGMDLFLYLDGALQAQKNVGDGRITRLNVNVGLDDVSTHAEIEDVKLFPSALSPEEIAELGN